MRSHLLKHGNVPIDPEFESPLGVQFFSCCRPCEIKSSRDELLRSQHILVVGHILTLYGFQTIRRMKQSRGESRLVSLPGLGGCKARIRETGGKCGKICDLLLP